MTTTPERLRIVIAEDAAVMRDGSMPRGAGPRQPGANASISRVAPGLATAVIVSAARCRGPSASPCRQPTSSRRE
jgi:hypothetical protein